MVAQVLQDFHTKKLADAKKDARVFSWMCRTVAGRVDELQPRASAPQAPRAPPPDPVLQLESHDFLVWNRLREHRRKACNHWARTPGSLKALRSRPCNPTPLQAAAAARFFALTPELYRHPSAAVLAAMDAAHALEADLAAPGVEGRAGVVAVELEPVDGEVGVYTDLCHQMERYGALVT